MPNGRFIVLDGNDGSGKATQARLLCERLTKEGTESEKIDFPRYQDQFFGKLLAECLAGQHGDFVHLDPKIASTLYALDRLEATPKITEWLAQGKIVISDRFTSANMIHQAGKIEDAEDRILFLSWLKQMEHDVLGVPTPDAVVYLDVPVEVSLKLLQEKREAKNHSLSSDRDTVEEDRQYLERSHESARALVASEENWHLVSCMEGDAMRTPEDIHEEVYALVTKLSS